MQQKFNQDKKLKFEQIDQLKQNYGAICNNSQKLIIANRSCKSPNRKVQSCKTEIDRKRRQVERHREATYERYVLR